MKSKKSRGPKRHGHTTRTKPSKARMCASEKTKNRGPVCRRESAEIALVPSQRGRDLWERQRQGKQRQKGEHQERRPVRGVNAKDQEEEEQNSCGVVRKCSGSGRTKNKTRSRTSR